MHSRKAGSWIWTLQTRTHLLQGLHKLLDWDGAAQQRLQNLAVWDVITRPLSLLTTCGLGRPGRGLEQKETWILARTWPGSIGGQGQAPPPPGGG